MSDATEHKKILPTAPRPGPVGVGMPAWLWLNEYGRLLRRVFGHYPLLVGSALARKNPRDIDVRLILTDEEWLGFVGPLNECDRADTRWAVLCMAFSALGKQMTGLPIDFQLKTQAAAAPEAGYPTVPIGYYDIVITVKKAEEAEE